MKRFLLLFIHLTEVGRRTLSHLSRDLYNPDGYLAAVRSHLTNFPIALSFNRLGPPARGYPARRRPSV
jgi:hypothetical protein